MGLTLYPVFFSKPGMSTSSNPLSWVLVVVARMTSFTAGGFAASWGVFSDLDWHPAKARTNKNTAAKTRFLFNIPVIPPLCFKINSLEIFRIFPFMLHPVSTKNQAIYLNATGLVNKTVYS
jgi:hypothetical protein